MRRGKVPPGYLVGWLVVPPNHKDSFMLDYSLVIQRIIIILLLFISHWFQYFCISVSYTVVAPSSAHNTKY